jgi:hypothetical protein
MTFYTEAPKFRESALLMVSLIRSGAIFLITIAISEIYCPLPSVAKATSFQITTFTILPFTNMIFFGAFPSSHF